jgi:hypothetical protein
MDVESRPLNIFCDEAGHTGPAMLDKDQRYFAFSSVALSEQEARELVRKARLVCPVQMPELKAAKLLKSSRGRQLIRELLAGAADRYAVVVHDKLLALCAQFYEYIFEPVFKASPWFLYEKKLHHFVAMVLYLWFSGREPDAQQALSQFQAYMRSFDEAQAPLLFGRIAMSESLNRDPLESIVRFARASRELIVADNATLADQLPAEGRWILDLATTSIWTHLNHWGAKERPLAITCDDSRPLLANIPNLTGDDNDPGIRRARMKGHQGHLGWRLYRPVEFTSSTGHTGLQIADVIAGVAAFAIQRDIPADADVTFFRESMAQHALPSCILPNFEVVDLHRKQAAVNAAILYRLAERAELGSDLLFDIESDYEFAENGWDVGTFRMG